MENLGHGWAGEHGRAEGRRHGGAGAGVAGAAGDVRALLRQLVLAGGEFLGWSFTGTAPCH
jgi:hypothetical protein